MRTTERGQITIPKHLRKKYGITHATDLQFLEKEDGLLLVKSRAINTLEQFRGLAKKSKGLPQKTDDFLKAIREGENHDNSR